MEKEPPKVVLTLNQVKREVGAGCSDLVAMEIIKNSNPLGKIEEVRDALQKIKDKAGMKDLLKYDATLARLFVKNTPQFMKINENAKGTEDWTASSISSGKAAELFEKDPNLMVELSSFIGKNAYQVFYALKNPDVADMLIFNRPKLESIVRDIQRICGPETSEFDVVFANRKMFALISSSQKKFSRILEAITEAAGKKAIRGFRDPEKMDDFLQHMEGKLRLEELTVRICASDSIAVELGIPLDQLHDQPVAREKYLRGLDQTQVLGLLLSDPEYFYTSTNHMLFDRLKKEFGGRSITEFFREMKIPDGLARNFLLRAISYGRFFGEADSLLKEGDLKASLAILLKPIRSGTFDEKYYYLIANACEGIKEVPQIREEFRSELRRARNEMVAAKKSMGEDGIRAFYAIEYLSDERNFYANEKAYYNQNNYKKDGKTVVVQVFDKEDTETTHWE
ncbi:hypothetical protein HZC08_02540, partial [Candidatus Micrarchaeota archaeon]|nr:hypothetical protein [Candidatus Micrarchaeota archaeon]